MKYQDKYPDAPDMFRTPNEGAKPGIIHHRCEDPDCHADHKCAVCHEKCEWANTALTAYVCSEECNAKLWDMHLLLFAVATMGAN